jgi:hypothetical protein
MNTVTLQVSTLDEVKRRAREAFTARNKRRTKPAFWRRYRQAERRATWEEARAARADAEVRNETAALRHHGE